MTCKDKLKNFMNWSVPILVIILILDTIYNKQYDRTQLIKKRRIYHNFKNATMSIILKEWEKTYYDFNKLEKVTYILTHNIDITYLLLPLIIINNLYFKLNLYNGYNAFITKVINNPFWGIVGVNILIGIISIIIPIIDTQCLLQLIFYIHLVQKFCYLNSENITYYIKWLR